MITVYLYYFIRMYITTVFSHSDSCLYWCLAYICGGISALRIYIAVTSLYPQDRCVTMVVRSGITYPVQVDAHIGFLEKLIWLI